MHPSYTIVFGDPTHSEGLLAYPHFIAESSRENKEGFVGTTKPSLSSTFQLPLSQQAYPIVCNDYQPSVFLHGVAIIQTDQLGERAAELPINSLGNLEAAKPSHVLGHLSGISRKHKRIRWDHETQSFLRMSASSFSTGLSYGMQ